MKIIIERRITAGKDMRDYGSKLPNELARAGSAEPEGIRNTLLIIFLKTLVK